MKSQAQPIHSGRRSFGRSVARLSAISAAICVLLLLALSLWNLAAAKWQHERNPVPGSFYAVEGLQMHIDCSGTGSPAVVARYPPGIGSRVAVTPSDRNCTLVP